MIDKSIFSINSIFLNTSFKDKNEVFSFLSKYFCDNNYCNNFNEILEGFFAREDEGSTAFTDGIGIPHSKVNSIIKPGICILKNNIGINWESMDDQQTNFFIALAIPNLESSTIHLKMLSSIARKLVDKNFKENLLKANTIEEIYNLLSNVETNY